MIRNKDTFFVKGFRFVAVAVVGLLIVGAGTLSATTPPEIQGRWEFVATSGDTSTQLAEAGPSSFSTYLTQAGPSIRNIQAFTTDFVACDYVSNNNITVIGTVDVSGHVDVAFTVALPDNTSFQYVFSGNYVAGSPTTITGTYQRTAGGCTQGSLGIGGSDGTFVATYFPDLAGSWAGAFDPDNGTGAAGVPASFSLTTNTDKTLSGTVTSPGLVNGSNVACLVGPVTLKPLPEGTSYAAGVGMELYGTDAAGTKLWVIGESTNPDGSTAAVGEDNPSKGSAGTMNDGTNNAYTAFYGISGGPCDGMGGGDAPFRLISKQKDHPKNPHVTTRYQQQHENYRKR